METIMNDYDITEFERQFNDSLLELQLNRKLFVEKNNEIAALKKEKSDLSQELEKERISNAYIQKQLDDITRISKQREETWTLFRDKWAQHKITYEILSKTSEAFKSQISTQELEIKNLKTSKQELEQKFNEILIWKKKCGLIISRVESTIETLTTQVQKLEQDQIKLTSQINTAMVICNKTEQFRKECENSLKRLSEQNMLLNKKGVELSMQLEEFKMRSKTEFITNNTVVQDNPVKYFDEWKEYQKEVSDNTLKNYDKLQEFYGCLQTNQKIEKEADEKIKELEMLLNEEREKLKVQEKPEVQNVGCQVDSNTTEDSECTTQSEMAENSTSLKTEPANLEESNKVEISNTDVGMKDDAL